MKRLIAILILTVVGVAQAPKPLSEVNNLKVVTAYQKAFIAVQAANNAAVARDAAVKAFQDLTAKVAEEEKLPKGTTFNVNLDTSVADPVIPASKPAEKK